MASPQVSGVIACVAGGNPRFTQADAFGYLDYFSVYDDMTFDVGGGGLTDNTSQFGSPNKYLICKNPRQDVGYISRWTDLCSDRYSGNQVFPRQKVLHGPRLKPLPQTYTFTVTASNTSNYTLSGDATGDDPTINCKVGDTLVFNLSTGVINHPFWIKTSRVTGTGSGVFTGTLSSNGQTTGTMTWDTTGVSPGIYYYVCQYHINMSGQITITSA
jgi:plastocyanin